MLALLATALLLTGCTTTGVQRAGGGAPPSGPSTPAASVPEAGAEEVEAARVAAGIADCPVADPAAEPRPDGLPPLVLPCLGGRSEVDLSRLRGQPMMVNVWASWCTPCRAEAPYLSEVAGLTQGELLTVGLLYQDADPLAAIAVAEVSAQRYPHLVDQTGAVREPLRVLGPPVTFFVTADGRLAHTHVGPFTSSTELRELLGTHLGVDVPG
ncbi:TlpA family protein disulfide reductase [Desertihabitans brevis]|uniref:TlpA family protein disulfide reductase n=1 Tax=Desertihabitans brevis TaxID=2268447 RepID=A0A367YQL5_9ACTN|nr:TlpA family protein disulfide reductase [Desertihabitans brevis]